MPAIAGLRGTGDWGTDERPKNFRETILWLNPNGTAPLTALMSRMGSQSTDDPEFSWWQEVQGLNRVQAQNATQGTAFSSSATTLPVAEGALGLVKGDLLLVEDNTGLGEIVAVTEDPSVDTSIKIERGAAGSTAAAIPDDAYLTKIGNAFAEGTGAPKATTRNPTKLHNFTQIFKTTYDITRTAAGTRTRTGDPIANDKKRKMFDHSQALELAFFFGKAYEAVGANGKPLRYTGGLNSFLSTNRTIFSGTSGATGWTEDNFIDSIAAMFDYDGEGAGDERLGFCGNQYLTALNKLARNSSSTRINFDGTIKTYGMNLQRWIIPQGVVYLRTHPLFNVHPVFTKSAFFVNPRGIIYRPFMDTKFKDNIQLPDADERKGEWKTEAGLEVHFEQTMAYQGNAGG